jgi:hypothetical protein
MPQEPFKEKPLIQCHIVLVPIGDLLGHEQIVQTQVDWLKNNLKKLGYFFRPILIVKNHNVILDGHHRVVALQQLGYSKVPCIEMKYLDNKDIQLGTWFPVYTEKGIKSFPSAFKKIGVEWKRLDTFSVDVLDNPNYGFTLKTLKHQFLIKGTQQEIYAKFLAYYNPELFEYVKTLDYALHLINNGHAVFILVRKRLKKQDVLETAKKGIPLAPKTTRHILSFKYQDIKVPLSSLV